MSNCYQDLKGRTYKLINEPKNNCVGNQKKPSIREFQDEWFQKFVLKHKIFFLIPSPTLKTVRYLNLKLLATTIKELLNQHYFLNKKTLSQNLKKYIQFLKLTLFFVYEVIVIHRIAS